MWVLTIQPGSRSSSGAGSTPLSIPRIHTMPMPLALHVHHTGTRAASSTAQKFDQHSAMLPLVYLPRVHLHTRYTRPCYSLPCPPYHISYAIQFTPSCLARLNPMHSSMQLVSLGLHLVSLCLLLLLKMQALCQTRHLSFLIKRQCSQWLLGLWRSQL